MRQNGRLTGVETSFCAEIFRSIRFSAAILASVIERRALEAEQIGGLKFGPCFCQRMCNALILANRPANTTRSFAY